MAVMKERLVVCELLLQHDNTLCSQTDFNDYFPLMHAAEDGHVGVMKLLLDHGANVNEQGVDGLTALHLAAMAGRCQAVTYLLQRGADYEIADDEDGEKAYEFGCYDCFAEIGCPLAFSSSCRDTELNYFEELDADVIGLMDIYENSWQTFSWIPTIRQRMSLGYCFATQDGCKSVFIRLYREALKQDCSESVRQAAIDCIAAILEGALLANVDHTVLMKAVYHLFLS